MKAKDVARRVLYILVRVFLVLAMINTVLIVISLLLLGWENFGHTGALELLYTTMIVTTGFLLITRFLDLYLEQPKTSQ